MNAILWVTTVTLAITAAHSYILLTANLEDVQSIAKQIGESPIADQIKKILRRATNQFHQQLSRSKMHKRAEEKDEKDDSKEEKPARNEQDDHESGTETDDLMDDKIDLRRSDGKAVAVKGDKPARKEQDDYESGPEKDNAMADQVHADGKAVGKGVGDEVGKADDKADERTDGEADSKSDGEADGKADGRTDGKADDVVAMGKNASYYLSSIKNMMDNI